MADNIAITSGSGTSVATDDVGGVHYQKVKLAIGASDTANLLSVGAGDVDTGTPRVTLADDDPAITHLAAIETAVEAIQAEAESSDPAPTYAALQTDTIVNGTTELTPKFAVIDDATSGDNEIVAAVTDKKLRVLSYVLISAGTVTARFESGAGGTALTGQMSLVANSGVSAGFTPIGHFETAAGAALNLELSAAVSVDGHLTYIEV